MNSSFFFTSNPCNKPDSPNMRKLTCSLIELLLGWASGGLVWLLQQRDDLHRDERPPPRGAAPVLGCSHHALQASVYLARFISLLVISQVYQGLSGEPADAQRVPMHYGCRTTCTESFMCFSQKLRRVVTRSEISTDVL